MEKVTDYLIQLELSPSLTMAEITAQLAARESQLQVWLKIPVKRHQARQQMVVLAELRNLLTPLATLEPSALDNAVNHNIENVDVEAKAVVAVDPVTVTTTQRPLAPSLNAKNNAKNADALNPPLIVSDRITNSGELGLIRQAINRWASTIANHDYRSLGSDCEILQATRFATYTIKLCLLVEKRQLVARQQPYSGEALPVGAAVTMANFPLWQAKVVAPVEFTATTCEQEIFPARQQQTCSDCQGEGEIWCNTCRSTGQVLCSQCSGRRQIPCSHCQGETYVNLRREECNVCQGLKIHNCSHCQSGWNICSACNGQRKQHCVTCNGKKALLHTLVLIAEFAPQTAATTVFPTVMPLAVQGEVAKHHNLTTPIAKIDGQGYPTDNLMETLILSAFTSAISSELTAPATAILAATSATIPTTPTATTAPATSARAAAKSTLAALDLASSSSSTSSSTSTSLGTKAASADSVWSESLSTVVSRLQTVGKQLLTAQDMVSNVAQRYQIQLHQAEAIAVDYQFEGEQYQLWLCDNLQTVICDSSPIKEFDKKMAAQARQLFAAGSFSAALKTLARGFEYAPSSASGLMALSAGLQGLQQPQFITNYRLVCETAALAESLLGKSLTFQWQQLAQQLRQQMRVEYLVVSAGSGLLTLLVAWLMSYQKGNIYAANFTIGLGLVGLLSLLGVGFYLAPQIFHRQVRFVLAAGSSLILVILIAALGIVNQDLYVTQQKMRSKLAYKTGDYADAKAAIEPLETALWTATQDAELQLMLGRAYARATYYEKAQDSLNKAAVLQPDWQSEIEYEMGQLLLSKRELTQAAPYFLRAMKLRAPLFYREALQGWAACQGLVYLPGGSFTMGNDQETVLEMPSHLATLPAFLIGKLEVTNAQYAEFIANTGYKAPPNWKNLRPRPDTEDWPVTAVSLVDVRQFLAWRQQVTGLAYRLPSEAEWEFAARGVANRQFPWGNTFYPRRANINGNEGHLAPVGHYREGTTPEGVGDLLGNAAEWVSTPLAVYPGNQVVTAKPELALVRGGSYKTPPAQASLTARQPLLPTESSVEVGFRVALDIDEIKKLPVPMP